MLTVQDIYAFIDEKAPFATAESWDNPGLLVGDGAQAVTGVVTALDATPGALAAARALGANLLLTHHPVIFSPLRRLQTHSMPYRLACAGVSLIAAHTNLDKAPGGVSDTLANRLGLTDVYTAPDGMCRIGTLPTPTDSAGLASLTAGALEAAVRVCGNKPIRTVAVCGGGGGDCIPDLIGLADAFVTGEVKHHQWLEAAAGDLTVVEAGHYATEVPVIDTLAAWLTEAFPGLAVTPYRDGEPYTVIHK